MNESALAQSQDLQVWKEPLIADGRAHGVWAPALTPLNDRLEPDKEKAVDYYLWLLEAGCHGLAFMGTNSEATSFSVAERIELLEAALAAGIDPKRLMVGSGCAALSDSVTLTRHATAAGCSVLTLPPFYYKDISEKGLYASYAELIERVASPDLRLYFYHFPKLSMVSIVHPVIERLLDAYPGAIKGLKDSSGDAAGCAGYIERFADLAIFPGNELLLLDILKGRAPLRAGCGRAPDDPAPPHDPGPEGHGRSGLGRCDLAAGAPALGAARRRGSRRRGAGFGASGLRLRRLSAGQRRAGRPHNGGIQLRGDIRYRTGRDGLSQARHRRRCGGRIR
jgi:4-hydroxy-tetrahydrodipicolinate synthase